MLGYRRDMIGPTNNMLTTPIFNANLERIPTSPTSNPQSTLDTLRVMKRLAIAASRTQVVKDFAQHCIDGVPNLINANYDMLLLQKVFVNVKGVIHFQEDEDTLATEFSSVTSSPYGMDLLISPDFLLQMGNPVGDCDEFTNLAMSTCLALGFSPASLYYITIAADPNYPENYTHVYMGVAVNGQIIYLDCSHGHNMNWEYPNAISKKLWKLTEV